MTQRIPTVRPTAARLLDAIERHRWLIVGAILTAAVLVNVGA